MRVQANIGVNRPAEAIFACMTSVPFLQRWVAPFRVETYTLRSEDEDHSYKSRHTLRYPELRQVSEGVLGVGTIFKQSNESRFHPSEAIIEITRYEPATTLMLKVITELDISQIQWVLRDVPDETTRVLLIWEQIFHNRRVKLLGVIAWLLMRNKIAGSPQYMQKLKTYLEEQCKL